MFVNPLKRLILICGFSSLSVSFVAESAAPTDTALRIGTSKQLFIDDYVLESTQGVFALINQPLKYAANPVIEMDRSWEADMHFANSTNVIYDEEEELFKMWHQVVDYGWRTNLLAYYVSRDGIHWEKPQVGQFEFVSASCYAAECQPTRNHNFVFGKDVGAAAPGVFKDPHEKDPGKRYKMLYRKRSEPNSGVWAAYSPDGIRWTDYPSPDVNPVFLNNDTHQVVFWDPRRQEYVAHIRLWPPVFKDDPRFHAGGREGRVRVPAIATSKDFLKWDAPKDMSDPVEVNRKYFLLPPDERDGPCTGGFYSLEALYYEGIYLGFPTPYHICPGMERSFPPVRGTAQIPWLDIIDVQLASSRDGINWRRAGERRPFLPTGPPGSYDAGMIFVSQQPIVREDLGEIWFYYVGYRKGHWAERRGENEESTINLARLRLDGFVSLTGGQGTATTKALVFEGNRLHINAATAGNEGAVAVEILDAQTDQPIPGFSREDCDVFRSDDIRHTVTWKGQVDVGRLAGKPVKLRFHLERAKLFSFQFQ